MCRLGVNIDHVATLRQARGSAYPDPVEAAFIAERAGCDQITVHLREDRRHIQPRDVEILRQTVTTQLNLEMALTPSMVEFACRLKPDIVTLVPEKREELTTEGGLDVQRLQASGNDAVAALNRAGISVMLFIDPDAAQIAAAAQLPIAGVEFHTGHYATTHALHDKAALERECARLAEGVRLAQQQPWKIACGHGLHYSNLWPLLAMTAIEELNIGHAIISRAVMTGLDEAVRQMLSLIKRS